MSKQHSPTVKAQLVLELRQDLRPVTPMAAEYGIAPRLLHRWRKEAVDHRPDLFADPAAAPRGALGDRADPTLSVRAPAGLVGVSRARLYDRPRLAPPATAAGYHRIDEIYMAPRFSARADSRGC